MDDATSQAFTFAEEEPFRLESGETLAPVTVAYQTYGRLNAERSNAILICHALSGSQHAAGSRTRVADDEESTEMGWWFECIGPGKAFDTQRFFVICSNVIGSCYGSTGPASPNPRTGQPYGLSFPVVTVADMVEAQVRLLDHLGIERLLAVSGGSLGGMQALQWASRHPDRLRAVIPIATTARHSPQQIAFDAVGREAIFRDPYWRQGDYYGHAQKPDAGLAVARMIGHITYLSNQSMQEKFGRRLRARERFGYEFRPEFEVETYLAYNGDKFTDRFDANSYLYITKAMDYFDLSRETGRLADAFRHATALQFLVVSFTSDWLYPSYQSKELVRALNTLGINVSYVDMESVWGHDAFLLETDTMKELISNYLKRLAADQAIARPAADSVTPRAASAQPAGAPAARVSRRETDAPQGLGVAPALAS